MLQYVFCILESFSVTGFRLFSIMILKECVLVLIIYFDTLFFIRIRGLFAQNLRTMPVSATKNNIKNKQKD